MKQNRIRETGERTIKLVSYSLTILFVLVSLIPLAWMVSSSLKDDKAIRAYPPQWLPSLPRSIQVTLDYTGMDEAASEFYEKDAMKAMWYPWVLNKLEGIGEVKVRGIKDGRLIYSARTTKPNFLAGQTRVVPTSILSDRMMDSKLPIIRDKKLSSFQWYGLARGPDERPSPDAAASAAVGEETLSGRFLTFYASKGLVQGKVAAIAETPKLLSLFDSFLGLNKLTQSSSQEGSGSGFGRWFANSVTVTLGSIASQLFFGGLAGYAISHLVHSRRLKTMLLMFFTATLMISDTSMMLPLYVTINELHLMDTLWGIILPHTAWGIVVFLFKGFFDQLPKELLQAAKVDGAADFRIFYQIAAPMSIPIFTVVGVMTFLPVWNEFMWPLVVAKSQDNWTVTLALNNISLSKNASQNLLMAGGVISMIPLLLVFLTSQKYIEKGVSFTGVKG